MLKRVRRTWKYLFLLPIAISLVFAPLVSAQSDTYQTLTTPFYDPNSVDGCTSPAGSVDQTTAAPAQLNLASIAKKYGIDTALVKQLNGDVIDGYNQTTPPNSPASVLKLIIADVFLNANIPLDKQVKVLAKENYFGASGGDGKVESPKTGQTLTLRQALQATLTQSSDTDANILMDQVGGPGSINSAVHNRGYKNTDINAYYSDSATKVLNSTTVTDLTAAMENIFSDNSSRYQVAQAALASTDRNTFGIANADASKWGGVPGVSTHKPATGNSALFTIGGKRYIITMYTNQPWQSNDSPSVGNIRNATNDIVSVLNSTVTTPTTTSASPDCVTSCVPTSADSVYRFVQTLAFKESGGSPTVRNSAGATGKYQYMNGTWQSSASSYYAPGSQFLSAADAPEEVQDAVAFIEYSVKAVKYNNDLTKMAISHYLPAALTTPSLMDQVPPGNTETPRQYGQNFMDDLNAGKGASITLKFDKAPDFANWYAKSVGRSYDASQNQSTSTTSTCSAGIPSGSFVFYNQYDPKWTNHAFGSSTIGDSGCGPTSLAMVVATLADKSITPVQTADYGTNNGGYIPGEGSAHGVMFMDGPKNFGLQSQDIGKDFSKARQIIKSGGLVIAAGAGLHPFSTGGHIIVLRAIDANGRFLIGNPAPNLQDSQDQPFSQTDLLSAGLTNMYGVTK